MTPARPLEGTLPRTRTRSRPARWHQTLRWRLNRLRCMTPAEVLYRLGRSVTLRLESLSPPRIAPPAALPAPGRPWVVVPEGIDAAPWLAAADRVLAGRYDIFALKNVALGDPPRWNRDPKSGIEAPLHFGKRLNYRDPTLVGDIKYLWEPNRHAHLVTLAQAAALSGDARYAEAIIRQLDDWFTACPPGRGANWSSALEAAMRLIAWSAVWHLLGGADGPWLGGPARRIFRDRWLASIWHHCRFIRGFFSLYSSANNHLIGEAAGLYVAAATWPAWPASAGWLRHAQRVLEEEAQRQNGPDGVNREQSTAYLQYEFELLLVAWLAARANGLNFSAGYAGVLERQMEFIASIMDSGGHVPLIGDADDATALPFDPTDTPARRYANGLALGALLFGRPELKAKAGALPMTPRWLVADAAARYARLGQPRQGTALPLRQAFPEGGYYILGCAFETPDEIRLVADAGPLGYGGIAAHGHADALAFTLSVGGREFLVDTGTYAYHTHGPWRRYFRSTAAHNTLRIDGQDQSVQGGPFLWLKKADARCSRWQSGPDEDLFEGRHDGYRRLPDPVQHRRRIVLDKPARRILIEDRLEMEGEHEVELFFHIAEDIQMSHSPEGYLLADGAVRLLLSLPRAGHSQQGLFYGSHRPMLGWRSRRFDERLPITTLRWRARLTGNVTLYTRILCSDHRGEHSPTPAGTTGISFDVLE